jgi:hypothetical protein
MRTSGWPIPEEKKDRMLQPWQNVQSERKRGLPPAFHLLHGISNNSEETGGISGLQDQGIEVWRSACRSYLLLIAAMQAMKPWVDRSHIAVKPDSFHG